MVAVVDDDNIPLAGWGENLMVDKEVEVNYYETDLPAFDPIGATNHAQLCGYPLQLLAKRDYCGKTKKRVHVDVQVDFWNGAGHRRHAPRGACAGMRFRPQDVPHCLQ